MESLEKQRVIKSKVSLELCRKVLYTISNMPATPLASAKRITGGPFLCAEARIEVQ
jgi:hypothetical protein